jgi:hypothetical protein
MQIAMGAKRRWTVLIIVDESIVSQAPRLGGVGGGGAGAGHQRLGLKSLPVSTSGAGHRYHLDHMRMAIFLGCTS